MGIDGGSDGPGQAVADPQADHFSRKDVIYNKAAAIYNKAAAIYNKAAAIYNKAAAIYNKHTPLGQRIYRKHSKSFFKVMWKVVELQFFLFMIIEKNI